MHAIPFDVDTLKRFITDENHYIIEIDYKNSKLKGKHFLLYLSNLKKLDFQINLEGVSFEERCELLIEYIKSQTTLDLVQFRRSIIKILFRIKMYDLELVNETEGVFFSDQIIKDNEIDLLIQKDVQLFKDLEGIIDGVILYAIKNINRYKQELGDYITPNIVKESTAVGKTWVNLFQDPVFNENYLASIPNFDDLLYYEYYYDKPIYSGNILLNYLNNDCLIFPILDLILDEFLTPYQLSDLEKEASNVSSV
jgi:hypothetical protein